MAETVLSTRGQVVIPVDVRRELGLGPSDRLRVTVRDGEIVLTPVDRAGDANRWTRDFAALCADQPRSEVGSYHDLLDEELVDRGR
jgi:AbrB family looped-hinge helix DNA binding protein